MFIIIIIIVIIIITPTDISPPVINSLETPYKFV